MTMIITDDHLNKIAKSAPNCAITHHFIRRIKSGEARHIDDIIEFILELAKQNESLKNDLYVATNKRPPPQYIAPLIPPFGDTGFSQKSPD